MLHTRMLEANAVSTPARGTESGTMSFVQSEEQPYTRKWNDIILTNQICVSMFEANAVSTPARGTESGTMSFVQSEEQPYTSKWNDVILTNQMSECTRITRII